MRIHIQTPPGDQTFAVTPAQWEAALARSPDPGPLWLTWTRVVRARFPAGAQPAIPPCLKVIACTSAGLDRLAPFDWLPDGVTPLNDRGTHAAKAGGFALMALLMLAAQMPLFATQRCEGSWAARFGSALACRTVCIVGLGAIGGAAARHARSFGMRVIGVRACPSPHPDCDEVHGTGALDALLPPAEFLLLACPQTPETRGLLDAWRLALLPRGAKVVNMARGAVWDQDAVCDLLDSGHLDGAITDVAVPEPLPPGHRLWRTPRLMVVPHVSSDDPNTCNDRTPDILLANLAELRAGRPAPNRVDPARGY